MSELEKEQALKESISDFKAVLRNIERAEAFWAGEIQEFHKATSFKYFNDQEQKQDLRCRLIGLISRIDLDIPKYETEALI